MASEPSKPGVVLDSSAIVAVAFLEGQASRIEAVIESSRTVLVGAPTLLETAIVLSRRYNHDSWPNLHLFLEGCGARVVAFTEAHSQMARTVFLRYGKGRHPAALNFGDCISYATARLANLPLLYTGDDFAKTDIPAA